MIDLASVVKPEHGGERHGLVCPSENCGLVHIVPESTDAHAHEILVQRAPPGARSRKRELGKNAVTGPDLADVNTSIGILHKMVSCDSFVMRFVTGRFGDVKISDQNGAEPLGAEVLNHSFKAGEILAIDSKGAITLLIINVQVDHVRRDFLCTEGLRQFPNLGLRIIAVAALLIAQGP